PTGQFLGVVLQGASNIDRYCNWPLDGGFIRRLRKMSSSRDIDVTCSSLVTYYAVRPRGTSNPPSDVLSPPIDRRTVELYAFKIQIYYAAYPHIAHRVSTI